MAIKINRDGIQFRNFSITNSVDGIYIDGTFTANGQFVDATQAQGSSFGYASGGQANNQAAPYGGGGTAGLVTTIDKYSFVSDGNATGVGDLTQARRNMAGASSSTNGYTVGGQANTAPPPSPTPTTKTIDKFPFATDTNATDVGDLSNFLRDNAANHSSTDAYSLGGFSDTPTSTELNVIDKFPFATDTNATAQSGTLTAARYSMTPTNSTTHGYVAGGRINPPSTKTNAIEKFPFSIDVGTSDVGDLSVTRNFAAGQNSSTHGYTSGGSIPPGGFTDAIEKFPFSSDNNSGDVGDLTVDLATDGGTSSTSSGYTSGGTTTSPTIPGRPFVEIIHKFPFSVDTDASDVGNLTQQRGDGVAGQQV